MEDPQAVHYSQMKEFKVICDTINEEFMFELPQVLKEDTCLTPVLKPVYNLVKPEYLPNKEINVSSVEFDKKTGIFTVILKTENEDYWISLTIILILDPTTRLSLIHI